jgi:ComF family protein
VGALKSRGAVPVADVMAAEISVRAPPELMVGTLVPVPAHPRRRRRHGFNQAEAIADGLARRTGCDLADVLARSGAATPQVGVERRERLANVHGSVRLADRARAPREAILVDDVYTTGGTLDACARVLRAGGARHVGAITFARALKKAC